MEQKNLIILGGGSIASGLMGVLSRYAKDKWRTITILADEVVCPQAMELATVVPIHFEEGRINEQLGSYVGAGDFVVNVTVSVGTEELILFCRSKGALYLDTSNEAWPCADKLNTYQRRETVLGNCGTGGKPAPTALICHGANPGMVTHFMKHALEVVGKNVLGANAFSQLTGPEKWGHICKLAGIDRIDISEHDSQALKNHFRVQNVEYNTWSVHGIAEESFEPSCFPVSPEFAPGCAEKGWPVSTFESGGRQLKIATSTNHAIKNSERTWIPRLGWFSGYMIPHPEPFSMAALCAWSGDDCDQHPTIRFVYSPCSEAESFLLGLRDGAVRAKVQRVMMEEIESGDDILGITVFLKDGRVFWYGSSLSIDFARQTSQYNNATSLQVVAGIYGGMEYVINHPTLGLIEPEQVDHEFILSHAKPFLGTMVEEWGWSQVDIPDLSQSA